MTREDKRDLIIAAIIFLIALLLMGWAYLAMKPEPYVTTVTSTRTPATSTGTPGNTAPEPAPYATVPAIPGQPGSTGTPGPVVPVAPTTVPRFRPVAPTTTTTVPLARGLDHQCGIRGGKVFCSGGNRHGQLGKRNADGSVDLPVKVEQVVAGQGSTCARGEGRVFCWGFRQGVGAASTAEPREIPVPGASKIYNGEGGTVCSVTIEKGGVDQNTGNDPGVLHCWGEGIDPVRGFTGRSWSDFPVEIARSADFDDVAVGWRSLCILTRDVTLKCYGGQPDGSHDPAGRVIGTDSGWHRVTVHRKGETHDEVCAHYWDGTRSCFG
jgi:hypothetical protein